MDEATEKLKENNTTMALHKKILKDNGIETEYHKINSISIKPKESGAYVVTVGVNSYITKDIRDKSEMYYVDSNYHVFSIHEYFIENQPIFKLLYDELKKLTIFQDAVDA